MSGGLADEVKLHLVNWKFVCQSIQSGGLGIKRFTSFNTALLGKWLWRFAMEPNALQRTVIANKYGVDEGWGGFLKTPDLWWEGILALGSIFGTTYGVGSYLKG